MASSGLFQTTIRIDHAMPIYVLTAASRTQPHRGFSNTRCGRKRSLPTTDTTSRVNTINPVFFHDLKIPKFEIFCDVNFIILMEGLTFGFLGCPRAL